MLTRGFSTGSRGRRCRRKTDDGRVTEKRSFSVVRFRSSCQSNRLETDSSVAVRAIASPISVETDNHVVTLSGKGEIELAGGQKIPLGPGHILLAEDVTGKGHISRGVGSEDRISLFITLDPAAK